MGDFENWGIPPNPQQEISLLHLVLLLLMLVFPLPFQLLEAFGRIARYAGFIGVIHAELEQPVGKLFKLVKLHRVVIGISRLPAELA